jgi:hypothetical protein
MIQLFFKLLNFIDLKQITRTYCPDCAIIEGILSYYPELRKELDIVYVDLKPQERLL